MEDRQEERINADLTYVFDEWGLEVEADVFGQLIITPEVLKNSLLRINFFPSFNQNYPEIPPIFSSKTFSPCVADDLTKSAPGVYKSDRIGFSSVEYLLTKHDGHSRQLNIPHPLPYAEMVHCLSSNWHQLSHLTHNTNSALRPLLTQNGSIFAGSYASNVGSDRQWMASYVDDSEYLYQLDIRNFFPSIYTHSVTWVPFGKEVGKAAVGKKRGKGTALENHFTLDVDKHLKNMNQRQTSGILVGPGTSNIIAEYLAENIDQRLKAKYGERFRRYVDDYKFIAKSKDEADQFRMDLEKLLRTYNLSLNPNKSVLHQMNSLSLSHWIDELQLISDRVPDNPKRIENLWNYIQRVAYTNSDMRILRYGMTLVLNKANNLSDEDYAQDLAVNGAIRYPYLSPSLGKVQINSISHRNLTRLANAYVSRSQTTYSDSKLWILYALLSNNFHDDRVIRATLSNADVLSWTLIHHFYPETKNHFKRKLDALGASAHSRDELWLLDYQMFLSGDSSRDSDGVFSIMKSHNVSFIAS